MRLRNGRSGGALLVAATLSVAGCGGDDGLSKAELVKKADPICKRHTRTIAAAAGKVLAGGKLPGPKEFGLLAKQTIIPEVSAQIKELRALKPSDDVAGKYKKWLDASEAAREKMEADPSIITNPASFSTVNGQADALGLSKDCHIGPGAG